MDLKLAGKTALDHRRLKGHRPALLPKFWPAKAVTSSSYRAAVTRWRQRSRRSYRNPMCASTRSPPTYPTAPRSTELARDYPDIDILVNNAGAIPGGSLLNVDEATWRKAWDLKVFGYVNMCRAFYALMQKRKRGVIVQCCWQRCRHARSRIHLRRRGQCRPRRLHPVAWQRQRSRTASVSSPSVPDRLRPTALSSLMKRKRTRSHRQRRQLEGPAQAAAIRPRRHRRGNPAPPSRSSLPTTRATPADPSSRSMPACPRAPRLSRTVISCHI